MLPVSKHDPRGQLALLRGDGPQALFAIVNLSPAPERFQRDGKKAGRAQFATLGSDIDVSAPNYIVDSPVVCGPSVRPSDCRPGRSGIKYSRTDFLLGENSKSRAEGRRERNQPESQVPPPPPKTVQRSPVGFERRWVTRWENSIGVSGLPTF